jgi:lipopolysaccharide/colanic/teichoic acid biosynthesis glycosyltransferase
VGETASSVAIGDREDPGAIAERSGIGDQSPSARSRTKRALDLVLAPIALVALAPVLLPAMLAVKLTSKGP